jgi:16S rRNA C967 or C1407 C5-methylase (RsmB/RsmF family)
MCAAPGSKTFQLLEMLHDGSSHGQAPPGGWEAGTRDGQEEGEGLEQPHGGRAPGPLCSPRPTPLCLPPRPRPGIVVANDADAQRCNLLTHQTKRMCSPCLMITNHGGEVFPRVSAPASGPLADAGGADEEAADGGADGGAADGAGGADGGADGGAGESGGAGAAGGGGKRPRPPRRYVMYDRVLADVPCSGEGTGGLGWGG